MLPNLYNNIALHARCEPVVSKIFLWLKKKAIILNLANKVHSFAKDDKNQVTKTQNLKFLTIWKSNIHMGCLPKSVSSSVAVETIVSAPCVLRDNDA